MIGGRDIRIPTTHGSEAMDVALRVTSLRWPFAVFEDARTGEELVDYKNLDLKDRTEILAYRDKKSAQRWREKGAVDGLAGTMIHFLTSRSELTIVADAEPSAEIVLLVKIIRRLITSIKIREE